MPTTPLTSLRHRLANALFGDIIAERLSAAAHASAISVRVDDASGWDPLTAAGTGPADRPWSELREDLDDALEAWRKNFLIRRVVALTRSYVASGGIAITSKNPEVDRFIDQLWNHPKNLLDRRLGSMCDELTRSGELFPILFTNQIHGMSYVRFVPAVSIRGVETDPADYERELRYAQVTNSAEPKWWLGPDHPEANNLKPDGSLRPLMLHFAVNRPIGATRGEGDLTPILPWARRYSEWLKDRVRMNRRRTRQGVLDIEVADDTMVKAKRKQLRTTNPLEHGIYVHGPGEVVHMHELNIGAHDAKDDGRALRLAIATGSSVGLHFLGEGEMVNYATAKEMGEPTARFYADRQAELCRFLADLVTAAYGRKVTLGKARPLDDLELSTTVAEVARADNESLAKAARDIVAALAEMKAQGWVDDQTAARLAFKFAGEPLRENEISAMRSALSTQSPPPPDSAESAECADGADQVHNRGEARCLTSSA